MCVCACSSNDEDVVGCLRSWAFEGSCDGRAWVTLDERTGDESLTGTSATHTFAVGGCVRWYRWVRVRITGENSGGRYYLRLSGMELYGRLCER